MNDTIAAISTAIGTGAISIIRISGDKSINIVNKIFKGKDLNKVESHTINYGHIIYNNEIIDEVLVSLMRAPKTFTTEDIIEINLHGGISVTNKVLEILLNEGCRLAEPGEFTKRAFLNGRINLLEAESIMDIINAKTEEASKLAVKQLTGGLSNLINNLRQKIIEILANIEVNIDYPEYEDIEIMTNKKIESVIYKIENEINKILKESKNGQLIKTGIKTVIIGKPNVGKSSILNNLLEEEKAIVTSIAGTTRDIVEGTINLDGLILNILDTAGIRKTDDIVESIGVNKSLNLIDEADLVLYVLNGNEPLTEEDFNLLEKIYSKNHIIIINKIDLEQKIEIEKIKSNNIVKTSIKNEIGINLLKEKIKEIFGLDKISTNDMTYALSARNISLLNEALISVNEVKKGILNNYPIDMVEIDLKNIWTLLGNIIGENSSDELINQLFSQFCLGK